MKNKFVALKPYNNKVFYRNKIFRLNNGNNAFYNFDKKMRKRGYDVETIDMVKGRKVDAYIYADVPYPWEIKKWIYILINIKRNILLCLESPLIVPFNHFRLIYRLFDKVFTWNDLLVDNKKVFKLYIPQIYNKKKIKPTSFKKKKFLVAVYSHRTAKGVPVLLSIFSSHKSNLYSKRMDLINYLDSTNIDFDLYGRGWQYLEELPRSYRGEITNDGKIPLISKYKYCLAFENSSAPGYITEKIFDCFQAGVVPVYTGAENITKYIPSNTFINAGKFATYLDLTEMLKTITESDYKRIQENGKKFLNNRKTKFLWFEAGFLKLITEALM